MDAVDFLRTKARMCGRHRDCAECPADGNCVTGINANSSNKQIEKVVAIVERWAAELDRELPRYAAKAKHKLHGDWGSVYVLCNYNTTHDEDMWRIETLISLGYSPYVMIYNKPSAPKITRHLQRWCNVPSLRKSCTFVECLKTKNYMGED